MNIYNYSLKELEDDLINIGGKKFNAKQMYDWIYKKKVTSIDEMSNISKNFRSNIKDRYHFTKLKIVKEAVSNDKTVKLLFELEDGNVIETVIMRHSYGNSVCVTTQVGCNIGCTFCASGLLKKVRDLLPYEIVLQVLQAEEYINDRVSSVVIMGIGEPFDNYDNVINFINIINEPFGLEIGARHITVSTSGLVNKINDFANEDKQVNLAISLHAASNETRNSIMKINNKYNLELLKESIINYIDKTNRRVTIEYILLKNINDSLEDAKLLAKYLFGLNVYVNLIPYNEVINSGYKRSDKETMDNFYGHLLKKRIQVTLRKEQGHDIDAACGQLRANEQKLV